MPKHADSWWYHTLVVSRITHWNSILTIFENPDVIGSVVWVHSVIMIVHLYSQQTFTLIWMLWLCKTSSCCRVSVKEESNRDYRLWLDKKDCECVHANWLVVQMKFHFLTFQPKIESLSIHDSKFCVFSSFSPPLFQLHHRWTSGYSFHF